MVMLFRVTPFVSYVKTLGLTVSIVTSLKCGIVYEILEHSYVSLAGVVTLLMIRFFFVPTKLCHRRRPLLGFLHADAHLTSTVVLMLLAELAIEICICNNPLATSVYHTLYGVVSTSGTTSRKKSIFLIPRGLHSRLEQWTCSLYPGTW